MLNDIQKINVVVWAAGNLPAKQIDVNKYQMAVGEGRRAREYI